MCVVDLDIVHRSQQTLECIAKEARIQDLTPLDDFDQSLPPHFGSRVSDESIDHVASDMKSTFVSAKIIVGYLLAKDKLRKDMKLVSLEDHQWHLRSTN